MTDRKYSVSVGDNLALILLIAMWWSSCAMADIAETVYKIDKECVCVDAEEPVNE